MTTPDQPLTPPDEPVGAGAEASAPVHPNWKRNATIFLAGQTSSMFGSMIVQYAVMWYVTFTTQSGFAIALYAVAAFLPQGIISIFGGVLADRINRKLLAMVSDSIIAVTTLILAVLMANGVTDLWIILLAVGVRSIGAGVQQPAVQAMIPQIVPPDQLMRINGAFQTMQSALALLAPAVAGIVYGTWGIVPTFFIDVVTAVIGVGLLALVPVPTLDAVANKTSSFRTDLAEGFAYLRGHAFVRWLYTLFAIVFVLTAAPSFVTPLLIARTYGEEVWMVTVLEIAFSVGMMLGGILVATILAKRSRIGLIIGSSFGFALFTAGLGLAPNLWLFYAFMFLFGLMIPLFSAPFMTLVQEAVRPEMHGRVFSYFGIVMALGIPIGSAVFGPLADVISVQSLLVIAGVVTVLVVIVALVVPSGRAAVKAMSSGASPAEVAERVEARAD